VLTSRADLTRIPAFSGDGRYVAFGDTVDGIFTSVVAETATGERVLEFDPYTIDPVTEGWPRALNHDGSLLLAGHSPVLIVDVATGEVRSRFFENGAEATSVLFSSRDGSVFSVGVDSNVYNWE